MSLPLLFVGSGSGTIPEGVWWDCIGGECVEAEIGVGEYQTLEACEAECVLEAHDCCGDCVQETSGQGTVVKVCANQPNTMSCGVISDPACVELSGNCTYDETAKQQHPSSIGQKFCGVACNELGYGTARLYDYASDTCV